MKTAYTVIIYDESGTRVATLNEAASPSYSRAKNTADQISVQIPRRENKISEVKLGRRFEIVRNASGTEVIETSGYISEHGYSSDWYEINGFTEEIFLSRYLTPAQYGYPFYSEQLNLEEFFSNFSRGFEVIQTKREWGEVTPTGFEIVAETNVDYNTIPDVVTLSSTGVPRVYETSGSITFRFTKASNELWDRVRWVSDYEEKSGFTTTVEYRTAADVGSLAGWSVATPGLLTDITGLIIAGNTDNVLEVRVNLQTTDTSGSSALYALEAIKRTPQMLTVDSSTYSSIDPTTLPAPAIQADRATFLDVLIDGCETADWQFRMEDGVLYFSDDFGVDRTNTYTLVES